LGRDQGNSAQSNTPAVGRPGDPLMVKVSIGKPPRKAPPLLREGGAFRRQGDVPLEPTRSGSSLPSRLERSSHPKNARVQIPFRSSFKKVAPCCLRDRQSYSLRRSATRAFQRCPSKKKKPYGANRRVSPYATTQTEPELQRGKRVRAPSLLHHQQQDNSHRGIWFGATQCKLRNAQMLDFLEQQFRHSSDGGQIAACGIFCIPEMSDLLL
jgi:hypothetical protein